VEYTIYKYNGLQNTHVNYRLVKKIICKMKQWNMFVQTFYRKDKIFFLRHLRFINIK
jgi:hypothetical protein